MGYYGGSEDYYTHTTGKAYDFRKNTEIYRPPNGEYSTHTYAKRAVEIIKSNNPHTDPLFLYLAFQSVHSPLQVPQQYEDMHSDIHGPHRKSYAGMVSAMDEAFGNITNALKAAGYWDNLLIIFTSDNGGSIPNGANNWPLRGAKATLWEGGTRVPAFVYSSTLLHKTGYVNNKMIHAVDWFPTIVSAAGGTPDPSLDGVSQWDVLQNDATAARTEFVYNIDEIANYSAIRVGDYKLIVGNSEHTNDWYHLGQHNHNSQITVTSPQLYNLRDDPTEHHNLVDSHPDIVQQLQQKLAAYASTKMQPQSAETHHAANPSHFNNTISPGWC